MPERPPDAAWLKQGAEPGLCGTCRHAKLNETRRGTAYLRCMRAAWDSNLSRYPRLPLHSARRGDYRVIYRIDDQRHLVTVLAIEHRSDVYRPRQF